jgi:hypothetical protein
MRNYLGSHCGGSICSCEVTYRPATILSLLIDQTGGPMGYGAEQEVNRRTTTTVSNQDLLLSAQSPYLLFCFKGLTIVVLAHPPESDNEWP